MCNDAVPLDLEGSMLLPVIPEREFVTDFLQKKKVKKEYLESHLFNLLQDFMEALQAKDSDKLSQMAEATFIEKMQGKMEGAPKDWFKF